MAFAHPFKQSKANLIRTSDKKALRQQLSGKFPSVTEDDWAVLLPQKGDISVTKLENKTKIYSVGDAPFFFELTDGDFYPTLYALWRVPHILPYLVIHGPVSSYIFSGADLMVPGILIPTDATKGGWGPWKKGDKRSVFINGNPFPFAVGKMLCNSGDKNVSQRKGKALEPIHIFHDHLWAIGPKEIPPGFTAKEVFALSEAELKSLSEATTTTAATATTATTAAASTSQTPQSSEAEAIGSVTDASSVAANLINQNGSQDPIGGGGAAEESSEAAEPLSAEAIKMMDEFLHMSFMEVIKFDVTDDSALPMASSMIYSKMIHCKPPNTTLDIKRSSYRKLAKFLNEMEARKYLKTKSQKGGEVNIVSINRQHPDYKKHKSFRPKESATGESTQSGSADSGSGSGVASHPMGIKVSKLFKASPTIRESILSTKSNQPKDRLYSAKEVEQLLTEYAESKNLIQQQQQQPQQPSSTTATSPASSSTTTAAASLEPSAVKGKGKKRANEKAVAPAEPDIDIKLDETLFDLLFATKKGTGVQPAVGDVVKRREITQLLLQKMTAYTSVNNPMQLEPITFKGELPRIKLMTERRMGKKVVTRVVLLDSYGFDLSAMAHDFQRRFATSTAVQEAVGMKQGTEEILVQGNVLVPLIQLLTKELGIPADCIEIMDKLNTKLPKK